MKALGILCLTAIGALLLSWAVVGTPPTPPAQAAASRTPSIATIPPQAALLASARADFKKGDWSGALGAIRYLNDENSELPDIVKIDSWAEKEQAEFNQEQSIYARTQYAKTMQGAMLDLGHDAYVEARGPKADVLYVRDVIINRPWVYQFENSEDVQGNLRDRGFRRAILTDGYGATWTVNIQP